MKNVKILVISVCLILSMLLLCGCPQNNTETTTKPVAGGALGGIDTGIDDDDINSDYNESNSTKVVFSGSSASVNGVGASISGADVRIGAQGTYMLSGSSSDGSVIIDSSKSEIKLVLNGLTLTNSDGPAILVKNAKKVTVTLADGTNNSLSDGASYTLYESNSIVDGTIFAKAELVFNGSGNLTVNGNNAHGIVGKDGLTITGGSFDVTSKGAGICGKDYLKIANATVNVNAGTDGLKSDNMEDAGLGYIYIQSGAFVINSANDAIQAYGIASIEGGTFDITTTSTLSTASAKGVKGITGVSISGGVFEIDAQDDGLHSDGDILVSGGDISIYSADDGVHANNTLEITNGKLIIEESYEGLEATNITISGGNIEVNSSDDGMNASGGNDTATESTGRPGTDAFESTAGSINISGGYIIVRGEGDGIDANGSLNVSGGVLLIDGPSRGGNGAFDYSSSASITGGTVVALSTSDMAQNFSNATQGSVLVRSSGSFSAGTLMTICDENGKVILAFRSTKPFNGALFSAPEIEVGKTYTFYQNATVEGLDENGYAYNTTQSGGESCGSVTLDAYICGQGSQMGGVPGGRPR